MKMLPIPVARALVLAFTIATVSALHAQAPATPAPPATSAPAATPAPKKPLSEADKRFFKDASEAIVFEQKLITMGTRGALNEESKKPLKTMEGELKRLWEKFATLSMEKGATIATEPNKSDASKAERIGKLKEEKFEKELIDDLGKEVKKTARLFDSKMLLDPELKQFVSEWGPTVRGHETSIERAEKALGKKK